MERDGNISFRMPVHYLMDMLRASKTYFPLTLIQSSLEFQDVNCLGSSLQKQNYCECECFPATLTGAASFLSPKHSEASHKIKRRRHSSLKAKELEGRRTCIKWVVYAACE